MGPDALAGAVARGGAPHPRLGGAARLPSPLRRQRLLGWSRQPRRTAHARPARRVHQGVARLVTRDWHEWYREYDDPASSLSERLAVVRSQLSSLLAAAAPGPVQLLGLCSGDGRDTLPVVAESGVEVTAVLVELDAELASAARGSAA